MMLADANVLAPHADQDSLITIEDNVKQHFVTIENIYIYIKKIQLPELSLEFR